ncbi:MAG TPA: CBS domain-containing protein [Gemmatimonadaceae bacterium]|nr:CBS domain-containing protein [Gemmatimonadaceae bacterium]
MLRIRDVMTADVVTVTPDTTLREAAELLAHNHVSGAPVVVGQKVVGVVSATDLIEFMSSNRETPLTEYEAAAETEDSGRPTESADEPPAIFFTELWTDVGGESADRPVDAAGPQGDTLSEHTVEEVMTREVRSLAPDLPATAAADFMRSAAVHRVLVMEQGRLVGIVTALDVARAAAEHRLGERRFVFDRPRGERGHDAGAF